MMFATQSCLSPSGASERHRAVLSIVRLWLLRLSFDKGSSRSLGFRQNRRFLWTFSACSIRLKVSCATPGYISASGALSCTDGFIQQRGHREREQLACAALQEPHGWEPEASRLVSKLRSSAIVVDLEHCEGMVLLAMFLAATLFTVAVHVCWPEPVHGTANIYGCDLPLQAMPHLRGKWQRSCGSVAATERCRPRTFGTQLAADLRELPPRFSGFRRIPPGNVEKSDQIGQRVLPLLL